MSDNRQLIHRSPQAVSAWELSQPWGIVWYSIAEHKFHGAASGWFMLIYSYGPIY